MHHYVAFWQIRSRVCVCVCVVCVCVCIIHVYTYIVQCMTVCMIKIINASQFFVQSVILCKKLK